MKGGTLFMFPTSAEAESFRTLRPRAKCRIIGVGMAEAGAGAAHCLAATGCRRAVLCGIAGACDDRASVGEAVEVVADAVAGLPAAYFTLYRCPRATELPAVRSLTVSRTGDALRGDTATGDPTLDALPLVEQMEGAAVAAACRAFGAEFVHLRAISNRVGDPRAEWRVAEAVEALARAAARLAEDE